MSRVGEAAMAPRLIATVLAVGALATAAAAHEPAKREVRRIVVHSDGKDGRQAHASAREDGCRNALARSETDVRTETDGKTQRTRIVICNSEGDKAAATAQVIEALEQARADLAAKDGGLGAEHRAKALAALDAEIARLKGR